MKEIISLHIGQGGVQLGNSIWDQFTEEHKINLNKQTNSKQQFDENNLFQRFFEEKTNGQIVPRSVFIDSDPQIINQIRDGSNDSIYQPDQFISGNESTNGNFAKGYFGVGQNLIDAIIDRIRLQVERCQNLEGFVITNSVGGGSGSGLTSLIQEKLSEQFEKKIKVGLPIFPSSTFSPFYNTETYNSVFSAHSMLEHQDITFLTDNSALFNICQNKLEIPNPNFSNINQTIAQLFSSITESMRFDGCLHANFHEIQANLVPFERFKFIMSSLSPLYQLKKEDDQVNKQNPTDMLIQSFDSSHMMIECNPNNGLYMNCALTFRGTNIVPKDVCCCYATVKTKRIFKFTDWSPAGCKVGINYESYRYFNLKGVPSAEKSVCMLGNSTAIGQFISNLTKQFKHQFDQRHFVQEYLNEKLEEQYFNEAYENLVKLEQEYKEAEGEQLIQVQKK